MVAAWFWNCSHVIVFCVINVRSMCVVILALRCWYSVITFMVLVGLCGEGEEVCHSAFPSCRLPAWRICPRRARRSHGRLEVALPVPPSLRDLAMSIFKEWSLTLLPVFVVLPPSSPDTFLVVIFADRSLSAFAKDIASTSSSLPRAFPGVSRVSFVSDVLCRVSGFRGPYPCSKKLR